MFKININSQIHGIFWREFQTLEEAESYKPEYRDWETDRKSKRLNSSHRL